MHCTYTYMYIFIIGQRPKRFLAELLLRGVVRLVMKEESLFQAINTLGGVEIPCRINFI